MFKIFIYNVFQPSPTLLDFELQAHVAVKDIFPLITIKVCRSSLFDRNK